MPNKIGYTRYDLIKSDDLDKIIDELIRYRYFITEKLICEITSEDTNSLVQYMTSIYLSTYSPLDPPIFILLPQLFNTSYTPSSQDIFFTSSFLSQGPQDLKLEPILEISLINLAITQQNQSGCLGGTFDHLHPGHLLLLTVSALLCQSLGIGITHESILGHKLNKDYIQPWTIRRQKVQEFLTLIKKDLQLDLFELFDPISKAGSEDYDIVILTSEVAQAFEKINSVRLENNLAPLAKFIIDLVEISQVKISSSDIRTHLDHKNSGKYIDVKVKWENLCESVGISRDINEKWWNVISSEYSRSYRHYHTLDHINSCLNLLATPDPILSFTIFFHDIVYFPMKHSDFESNESISAKYFEEFLLDANLPPDYKIITNYILATINHTPITNSLQELEFLDIDLSVLGSDWEEYIRYTKNIRLEYNWYDHNDYCNGRSGILKNFLSRNKIFYTDRFQLLETKARENISREISEILVLNS
jgi:predicted metal-dependent HD superfamily phosphohydrolase/phosphopantetheine adenylyltransferase